MEAADSSEPSVYFNQTTRSHTSEVSSLYSSIRIAKDTSAKHFDFVCDFCIEISFQNLQTLSDWR
jgi:hypothetical protein